MRINIKWDEKITLADCSVYFYFDLFIFGKVSDKCFADTSLHET